MWCLFAERSDGGGGGIISEDSILFTSTHELRTKTTSLISIDSYCSPENENNPENNPNL